MSGFGGKIEEIPGIAVDNFSPSNRDSDAFFLSHCHKDHMTGLSNYDFHTKLIDEKKFFYASPISCAILKRMFPRMAKILKPLEMHPPTIVGLRNNQFLSVTPIPAAHCPGSIMFLFEYGNKRILFTGDYRLNPDDLTKFNGFYDSFKQLKPIHNIYLDTTFFSKEYQSFPRRDDSLKEIFRLIKEWIEKSEQHVINLETPAKYGYEFLFKEIYQHFKMPIHLREDVCIVYGLIPELDGAVTTDSSLTQIHSSCGINFKKICKSHSHPTRVIKASAYRWKGDFEDGISEGEDEYFFVCYSTHASYEEGIGLLKFLKPKNVTPFVINNERTLEETTKLINEAISICANENEEKIKPFKVENLSDDESSDDEKETLSNFLDSPPRKRRLC